jgi:hypothetical protein
MTMKPEAWVILGMVIIALIIIAALLARARRHRQSQHLRRRFGPEYERLVAERGDRAKAEAELRAREKRVDRLKIVPLPAAEAAKFSRAWSELQARFVDNPRGIVVEADGLVRDLMVRRGYPMGDFEERAADISVDHPELVETYRAARAIAERDRRGEASTEELRRAVVLYRTMFDELLEVREVKQKSAADKGAMVHS